MNFYAATEWTFAVDSLAIRNSRVDRVTPERGDLLVPVVQSAETPGLNPAQCGFKSHRGHIFTGDIHMLFIS
jgi:hypothetical protein